MTYSSELLACFKEVPHFKENLPARRLTDDLYKRGCCACYYPILPLGSYSLNQSQLNPSKMAKIQSYALPLLCYVGSCLAFYGFTRSSPKATALGILPLAFTTTKVVSLAKRIGQALVGLAICPAAMTGLHKKFPRLMPSAAFTPYLVARQKAHALITGLYERDLDCTVTNIRITKNETTYDAYFIAWPENSKAWVVHALDGVEIPGWTLNDYPRDYLEMMDHRQRFNHVILAGPSVGHSAGWPTAQNIGEGYAATIQLLEQAGATHIVMEARGLFGGMTLAKAVEAHDFTAGKKHNIRYLAISWGTANSVAEAVKYMRMGRVAEMIVKCVGMNINSDKMNQKLEAMEINHMVMGHEDQKFPFDGFVHREASLYKTLKGKNLAHVKCIAEANKQFSYNINYSNAINNTVLAQELEQFLQES